MLKNHLNTFRTRVNNIPTQFVASSYEIKLKYNFNVFLCGNGNLKNKIRISELQLWLLLAQVTYIQSIFSAHQLTMKCFA